MIKDEYGCLWPTRHAFNTLFDILVEANQQHRMSGCASTDSEGGMRIEWIRHMGNVHLVVRASGEAYIYHQIGDSHGTEDVMPGRLTYLLGQIE